MPRRKIAMQPKFDIEAALGSLVARNGIGQCIATFQRGLDRRGLSRSGAARRKALLCETRTGRQDVGPGSWEGKTPTAGCHRLERIEAMGASSAPGRVAALGNIPDFPCSPGTGPQPPAPSDQMDLARVILLGGGTKHNQKNDILTAKSLWREYKGHRRGMTQKSRKRPMRMFGSSGNPNARNLFEIIGCRSRREGVHFKVEVVG